MYFFKKTTIFIVDNINWPQKRVSSANVSNVSPFVRANRGIVGCVQKDGATLLVVNSKNKRIN